MINNYLLNQKFGNESIENKNNEISKTGKEFLFRVLAGVVAGSIVLIMFKKGIK